MKAPWATRVGGAVLAALALAGCASSSNPVTVQESTTITKGRELSDLLRARQEGAIDDREYETLRRIIMRRPN